MFTLEVRQKISAIAHSLGVEPAALLAVAEVESAGVAAWNVGGKQLPAIRFEGHYFHRILKAKSKEKFKQAVAAGLANPNAGAVKNPTSYSARYALLDRAAKIDKEAAYESTSWGLGQVMGAHWKKLGYSSVEDMVATAKKGVDGQVEIMAAYIRKFGLIDELQSKGWLSFALQYNGPAARKGRYDVKIASAYKRYANVNDDVAETQGKNGLILDTQSDLKALGYYKGRVDGIAGDATESAIRRFQSDNGLVADGKAGPMTSDALDKAMAKKAVRDAENGVKGGSTMTGTGVAVETVNQASDAIQNTVPQLQSIGDYLSSPIIQVVIVALILGGLGLTFWSLFKRNKANKDLEA